MYISTNQIKLTRREKFKLFRNLSILLLVDLLALSLIGLMVFLYRKINLTSIVSTVLISLFIVLITLYASKYIRDIKRGVVHVFSGVVNRKGADEVVGDSIGSQYLYLNDQAFQVSFRTYMRVKVNDRVTIRKAPVSNYTLTVDIKKPSEGEKKRAN